MRASRLVAALGVLGALGSATLAARAHGVVTNDESAIATLWHVDGEARGTPAADVSTAYFLSRRHEVVAIDVVSGTLRWKRSTGGSGATSAGSTVLLIGSAVVAGDYDVFAFDRTSGATKWRFVPTDGYGPGIYLGGVAGDVVFAGSPSGRVYAVDGTTGTSRWSAAVAADGKTTVFEPVVEGGLLVAGYTVFDAPNTGGVVALDTSTGRELWRTPFPPASDRLMPTGYGGGPLIAGEAVVAASRDGSIHGLDRRSGSVLWSIPRLSGAGGGASDGADFRALARTGRTLVAGSLSGRLVAYDLDTRRERWRYFAPDAGSVAFSLSSDEQSVHVPYVSGRLIALNVEDGREQWRLGDATSGFMWPPVAVGTRLYAGGSTGFFAFERR